MINHKPQDSHGSPRQPALAETAGQEGVVEPSRDNGAIRQALRAGGVGCWDFNLSTGLIQCFACCDEIFGCAPPLPGWRPQEMSARFLAEDRASVDLQFAQAAQRGVIEFEKRIRRADNNELRWVRFKGHTYSQDGRPAGIAGVVTDVTGERLFDETRRQTKKMEAIGRLSKEVAHDFNNLLMIFGGSLEILRERVAGDAKVDRLFSTLNQSLARGATLTQHLAAFSQPQGPDVKAICVDELISSSRGLLDLAAGEAISIAVVPAQQLWFCRADSRQLITAIVNLVHNAGEAMPLGGVLTISTSACKVDDDMAAAVGARAGDYVSVSVADTGAGIAPDIIDEVFEPFFTTKKNRKGSGFGLSQVYALARQAGGFVTIESELNGGTTVAIHLPSADLGAS